MQFFRSALLRRIIYAVAIALALCALRDALAFRAASDRRSIAARRNSATFCTDTEAACGANDVTWVLTTGEAGMRSQALGLAEAVGLPIEEKRIVLGGRGRGFRAGSCRCRSLRSIRQAIRSCRPGRVSSSAAGAARSAPRLR